MGEWAFLDRATSVRLRDKAGHLCVTRSLPWAMDAVRFGGTGRNAELWLRRASWVQESICRKRCSRTGTSTHFSGMSDEWIRERTGIEEWDFGLGHGAYGAWLKLFLIGRAIWSIMSVWFCRGLGFHRHRGFVSSMYWSF